MTILVLDPASSTGYALVKLKGDVADIYEYGYINVDLSSDFQGDHCIDLMVKLDKIIASNKVIHIAVEDYFFNRHTCKGSNVNAAFRTAIHILARANKIPYTILSITSWKNFIAGRATPTKDQKKKWGKEPAKKLYIQEALWQRYKIRFPNHSISETTGKPIKFRYDIVDAVAEAVYFSKIYKGVRKVVCSVELPDDVVFKKPPAKMFEYNL